MKPGDRVEAKLKPGLGGWQRVTLIRVGRDQALVETSRGVRCTVPMRRVRTPKPPKQSKPKPRKCGYCGEVGHDIRKCEALKVMAASMTSGPVTTVTRPFTVERRPYTAPVPKPPPAVRSAVYLEFVRQKPCMWCGAPPPNDPDHVGPHGLGVKTDDLRTVPTCRKHHDERHRLGRIRDHTKEETMAAIYRAQVDLLVEFFRTHIADAES